MTVGTDLDEFFIFDPFKAISWAGEKIIELPNCLKLYKIRNIFWD